MTIIDTYPSIAQFDDAQPVTVIAEIDPSGCRAGIFLECRIYHAEKEVWRESREVQAGEKYVTFRFLPGKLSGRFKGYRVAMALFDGTKKISESFTAFDRAISWKYAPRYGFLTDFSEADFDDDSGVQQLNSYHVNVIMFYDWMYRHHQMLPPQDSFVDPLGRHLSLKTVKRKIEFCHQFGMKALAYGAVYAAQKEFYDEHKSSGLNKNDGKPVGVEYFLNIMDLSRGSAWHDHIIKEFEGAVRFGFDGIHMDQYGYPKEAIGQTNGREEVRHLSKDFRDFIDDVRDHFEKVNLSAPLSFNAVNNWPIETVANSKQDIMYVEIWSPNDTYQDIYQIIRGAKALCGSKQIVLAAYISAFQKAEKEKSEYLEGARNSALMTMATIFAGGGYHIFLGEREGFLQDPYFVNYHRDENSRFLSVIREYYDFITANGDLLFDLDIVDNTMTYTGGINDEYVFRAASAENGGVQFSNCPLCNTVWKLVKEKPGVKIIELVNYMGLENSKWDEAKPSLPNEIKGIEITALVVEKITGIYFASPDINHGEVKELSYETVPHAQGIAAKFTVPSLKIWDAIYILTEQ